MSGSLLRRVLVPIKSPQDTHRTCEAVQTAFGEAGEVTFLHVIEQTEGYMDTSSPEALEKEAREMFSIVRDRFQDTDTPSVRTELRYGTDTVDEIVSAASDLGATAIAFDTEPESRLAAYLTGDAEQRLISESPCPVIVIPDSDEEQVRHVSL